MMHQEMERWQSQPNPVGLSTDIDLRLADLFTAVWSAGTEIEELADERVVHIVGAAIRQAYARGYSDALTEDKNGVRSMLYIKNGYPAE